MVYKNSNVIYRVPSEIYSLAYKAPYKYISLKDRYMGCSNCCYSIVYSIKWRKQKKRN